ncbi:MAG: 2-succinyl-5-enolpyruvyl-6-hydroxy-3-cyclohexene-1-carboxylic-acid synthase [Ilumatobacteraceae bacterium]
MDRSPPSARRSAQDVQATYCATLVDEWIRHGVCHAVIAPGSRSTPMALALTDRAEMAVHVVHDERSAAFVALGLGIDGDPALLLCTSGTAAANFYPAVVEAGLSEVPMIVLTADRPDELRGVGAPQTIDQIDLFGNHVRWSRDPNVADDDERSLWRELAADAWRHATTGPVQLNLPFREPLIGVAGPLPDPGALASPMVAVRRPDAVPAAVTSDRGLILVGGRSGVPEADVAALQEATGWPILADPISGMRHLDGVVATADAILRHPPFADAHRPDVVVRIGRPAASKVLAQWVAASAAVVVQVGGPGVIDPDHNVRAVCTIESLLTATCERGAPNDTDWFADWLAADRCADLAIEAELAELDELSEPGVARCVATLLPPDAEVTVASSMPVRDLEWFGGHAARAHANRGANGIDGVTSTALGRALAGRAAFVLIGDFAFVHDSSALIALTQRGVDLRVVVTDNDGGGIFSFLPQATELPEDRFEQLFGTPLGVDVVALAAAHGVAAGTVSTIDELAEQLAQPGPWVVRVASNRQRNVEIHRRLNAAVAAALTDERAR